MCLWTRCLLSALMLGGLWIGCASPPPREAPELTFAVPEEFAAADAEVVEEGEILREWWRSFADARLERLIEEMLARNPALEASAARVEAAVARARLAGAPRLPQVAADAQASQARLVFTEIPFVDDVERGQWGVSLDVSWEADLWGELRSEHAAALTEVQAAQHVERAAMLSLTAQTAKAWFAAIEAQLQIELAEENLALLERTVESTVERFDAGLRPSLDYRLARTQFAQGKADLAARDARYQVALRQLELLVGRYPRGEVRLSSRLPQLEAPVVVGLPAELLVRRPDVRAAERQVAATDLQVEAARAALLPRLTFTGSTGLLAGNVTDLFDTNAWVWNVFANLLAPLFQGGALRANVALQRALATEALAEYVQVTLEAFVEVETALALESRLARRQAALEETVEQAQASAELSEERYERGLTDILTLLSAQRELNVSRSALLDVRRERLDNRIDLFLALGGGYEHAQTKEKNAER